MESVSQVFVGIDISKGWFDAFAQGREARFEQSESGFTRFLGWVSQDAFTVVLESTGGHERALRGFLDAHNVPVVVADPLKVRALGLALGKIHKTDRIDARMLALYGPMCGGRPVRLEREPVRELRRLVSTWNDLRSSLRALEARLRSPGLPASAVRGLEAARVGLDLAVLDVWQTLLALVNADEELRAGKQLLESIKGVGESAALQILSLLPEGGMHCARSLARYAGLAPCQVESGSSVRGRSRVSRRCNGRLRTLLYLCALSASRFCPHLRAFKQSLILRGKAKKQALIAVARKLAHAIYAVLSTRQPYDGGKLTSQPLTT